MISCEFSHNERKERWNALTEMWRWRFPHLFKKTEPLSTQSQPDSSSASPSSSKTSDTLSNTNNE